MPYNPLIHHRRSVRLNGYDYSQAGAYFVTMLARERACVFVNPVIHQLVATCWLELPGRFPSLQLDEWVLMPNHLHGIIVIGCEAGDCPMQLSAVISLFKSQTARAANRIRQPQAGQLWQRNYHDHIIRSERELADVRRYINDNPAKWELDENNPARAR